MYQCKILYHIEGKDTGIVLAWVSGHSTKVTSNKKIQITRVLKVVTVVYEGFPL